MDIQVTDALHSTILLLPYTIARDTLV